jgi:hypothetical protein
MDITPSSTGCVEGEIVTEDEKAVTEALLTELPEPHCPETFSIDNEEKANWLVRKLVELRDYRGRVETWAIRERKRAAHDEQFLMMRFGRQLEQWASSELGKLHGRRRSLNLPGATIGFRRTRAAVVIISVIRGAAKECIRKQRDNNGREESSGAQVLRRSEGEVRRTRKRRLFLSKRSGYVISPTKTKWCT